MATIATDPKIKKNLEAVMEEAKSMYVSAYNCLAVLEGRATVDEIRIIHRVK